MGEVLNWDDESAAYIRSRGDRYRGGGGVEPDWAQQVMGDPDLAAFEPDPKSRMALLASSVTPQALAESWSSSHSETLMETCTGLMPGRRPVLI